VEPVATYLAAAPGNRTAHSVLHRVEMHVELLGGDLVATAATQVDPQRVTKSRVILRVVGKIPEHVGYPLAGAAHVAAESRHYGQSGVAGGDHRRSLLLAHDCDAARLRRRPV